jgi:hypothetical protein
MPNGKALLSLSLARRLLGVAASVFVFLLPAMSLAQSGSTAVKTVNSREISSGRVAIDLVKVYDEYEAHQQLAPTTEFKPSNVQMPLRKDRVVIDAASDDALGLLRSLEALGLQNGTVFGRMVSGELPVEAIPQLESLPGLNFVRPAYASKGAGLVDSQGDVALRAIDARTNLGVDGTGVTVGTLSDSYNCLGGAPADVTNGDLPPGVTVLQEIGSCTNATDEGRGMMQIIRDLAPGAAQAFHSGFNGQANFAQGILDLANVANCDVICDDVFYFAEPFFQDGVVAQAVDNVVSTGVPYFALAGNHDRKSYESAFRPSGVNPPTYAGGNAHDFDPGPGVDIYQKVTIPNNTAVTISFQWDQPFFSVSGAPGSANDLDILIYNDPPTTIVASSTDFNSGADPVEVLNFNNTTGSSTFNIVLVKWTPAGGPDPGLLKYIALVNGGLSNFVPQEWDTQSGTTYGHMNSATGETVGAAFYFNTPAFGVTPPVKETYSSSGRTPILFDTGGNPVNILRNTPDICAVDGTNTTFFGSDISDPGDGSDTDTYPNFFGTSAATPHAAAVAALLLEAVPGLTPAQVYQTLETSAIDMDVPGWDDNTGYGLIQADAAICEWDQTPPQITCPSDITVECSSTCGAPATDPAIQAFLTGATATDECDSDVDITNNAPSCFPLGETTVTFTATDNNSNQNTCQAKVTVVDTTPPDITVSLNRDCLWPPNHKMASIVATVNVTDVCCGAPTFNLVSVTSNEPENGKGDGNTAPDIVIMDKTHFQLRSERAGGGDGRVYTIAYLASDCSGNTTPDTAWVRVPHDQGGHALCSMGFQADGLRLDSSVDQFALVVRSAPRQVVTDPDGHQTVIPAFDATKIDVATAYLGNATGVATPVESQLIDNNADGLMDLVLFYKGAEVNELIDQSAPESDTEISTDSSDGAIGLHYTTGSGSDFLVGNIFMLGEPVPIVPSIDIRRGTTPDQPQPETPRSTDLLAAYPNPFNPSTTIPFQLESPSRVVLGIYDASGRLVRELENDQLPAGLHELVWDGRDANGSSVATGVYFVRLLAGSREFTRKIVMLK